MNLRGDEMLKYVILLSLALMTFVFAKDREKKSLENLWLEDEYQMLRTRIIVIQFNIDDLIRNINDAIKCINNIQDAVGNPIYQYDRFSPRLENLKIDKEEMEKVFRELDSQREIKAEDKERIMKRFGYEPRQFTQWQTEVLEDDEDDSKVSRSVP